ncbi:hypothetical protein H0A36_25995 [Endozoicomonas sp. SM1973]|uniref:Uncharacterized protein n=1 Tax=Spartinivicinus marinus TaxID=2994442 RepID=A0A853I830_9GAMM|nr:hypothetical protein [Spartinivicinus marinus]NYZ69473.1 hypothetical protein [Spartinivicinus marinus]
MSDTNNTITVNHSQTAQECLDDAFFRCSQAKGLAKLLSSLDDQELATRGIHDLATVLVELMEDSITNISKLQDSLFKA